MNTVETKIVPIPGTSDFALIRGNILLEKITLQGSRAISADGKFMITILLIVGPDRDPAEYGIIKTNLPEVTKRCIPFPKVVWFEDDHRRILRAHVILSEPEIEKLGEGDWIFKIEVSDTFASKNSGSETLLLEYFAKRITDQEKARLRQDVYDSLLPVSLITLPKEKTR